VRYIQVKATAGARKESFSQRSENHFEISVREKAERNMANARVVALIAGHFAVPEKGVRIVNGHRHPSKLLVVEGV
jgi:uncharacterized protein YggU (UPF0235/DUF167 family)